MHLCISLPVSLVCLSPASQCWLSLSDCSAFIMLSCFSLAPREGPLLAKHCNWPCGRMLANKAASFMFWGLWSLLAEILYISLFSATQDFWQVILTLPIVFSWGKLWVQQGCVYLATDGIHSSLCSSKCFWCCWLIPQFWFGTYRV